MVVKDFGSEKVDFTREQQAHNQGMHPELVPIISRAFHEGYRSFLAST